MCRYQRPREERECWASLIRLQGAHWQFRYYVKWSSSFCTEFMTVKARITPFKLILKLKESTYFSSIGPLYYAFCRGNYIMSKGVPRNNALKDMSNMQGNGFANWAGKSSLRFCPRLSEPLQEYSSWHRSFGCKSPHFLRSPQSVLCATLISSLVC